MHTGGIMKPMEIIRLTSGNRLTLQNIFQNDLSLYVFCTVVAPLERWQEPLLVLAQ